MNILVSACLLGIDCRYNGSGCVSERVAELSRYHHLIPACPEQLGGLPTPRPPVELSSGRVLTRDGQDFTENFQKGAEETVKLSEIFSCECAVLKSRSPSCGCGCIYDGSFSGELTEGSGITANRLRELGLTLYNEDTCGELMPENS